MHTALLLTRHIGELTKIPFTTEIPLDMLNFSDEPPPNYPGSPFIPLPQFNGKVLNPSPEPSMWIPLASGLIYIGQAARRRSKNKAPNRP